MALSGTEIPIEQLLLAAMVDRLSVLVWFNTEDGRKGRRKPKSIVDVLQSQKKTEEYMSFETGAEFEKEWNRLCKGVRQWQGQS